MSDGLVIGIDPGKTGGIVALDMAGRPVEWMAADHPSEGYTVKGKGPREYVPQVMRLWLEQREDVRFAIIEAQRAMPMEGRTSVLTTGYGWGLWVGMCAGLGIPYRVVQPRAWMRSVMGTRPAKGEKKARSIIEAGAQVPALPLTWGRKTKPHDGLADAALMAVYALQQLRGGHQ
jgi:hypothetical protein